MTMRDQPGRNAANWHSLNSCVMVLQSGRTACGTLRHVQSGRTGNEQLQCAGVTRVVTKEQGIFKYFLKVVPTTFKRGYGAACLVLNA